MAARLVDPSPGAILRSRRRHAGREVAKDENADARAVRPVHDGIPGPYGERMNDTLDDVPNVVVNACMEAAEHAKSLSDFERRRRLAIAVCHCKDAMADDVSRVILLLAQDRTTGPAEAMWFILDHPTIARVAREVGYDVVPVLPDPGIGRMRLFLFGHNGIVVGEFVIEDESVVLSAIEEARKKDEAFARRLVDEKHDLVRRAVHAVLAKPGLRERQIVLVFGGRTGLCPTLYRELAALPAQRGFPPELPAGVPVIVVDISSYLEALGQHLIDLPRIDPVALGPTEVYVAVLMPHSVFQVPVESVPYLSTGN
jgi:hypothetical protein